MPKNNIKNKVIIVTGASSGIGEATVYELAKYSPKLILAARREEKLHEVAKAAGLNSENSLIIKTDLTKYTEIENLVNKTVEKFGRVDVLLNIAGWGSYGWIENLSKEDIKGHFDVNVMGLIYLSRLVVPIMKIQRSGHIINMSSYASRLASPPITIYAATKYAVEGFTDGLRRELIPWGIKVTRIHPGSVAGTEFNAKAKARGGVEYKFAWVGRISKAKMAKEIVKIIKNPKRELLISKLYEIPVFFNRHFPGFVDFIMGTWVKMQRKEELKK